MMDAKLTPTVISTTKVLDVLMVFAKLTPSLPLVPNKALVELPLSATLPSVLAKPTTPLVPPAKQQPTTTYSLFADKTCSVVEVTSALNTILKT